MTIDQAFRALILASETVAGLIGDRFEPGTNTIDTRKDLPKVVYTLIDHDPEYHDQGRGRQTRNVYQLDIFAENKSDADAIATAIVAQIDNYKGTAHGVQFVWITISGGSHRSTQKQPGDSTGAKRITRVVRVTYVEP